MWGKPAAPVGLFGKLPSHPDFVRFNASGPLPRALDTWLSEGLIEMRRQASNNWESEFDRAVPFFFIFRNGAGTDSLVGVCRPGRDQSGRRYPFTIFAQVTLERGGRGLHLIPMGYAPFLLAARRLAVSECADGIDNERTGRILALTTALPQNPVEVNRRFADHWRGVTMESFWRGVLGDFDDRRKYLVIKNLFTALAPWRGGDPARMNMILRFPAPQTAATAFLQTATWPLLVQAVVGEETLAQTVLFWHDEASSTTAGCYLSFHSPASEALPLLFLPSGTSENLWDLARIGDPRADDARAALGTAIVSALDTPSYTMKDFVERI